MDHPHVARGAARRSSNALAARLSVAIFAAALVVCAACRNQPSTGIKAVSASGGTVTASIRAEPRSFNRYVTRDLSGEVVAFLTHASLVRVDRVTQRLEPELAESWELLSDGVTYRLKLRHGLRFSDGEPFSSSDVVFSFRALYDPRGGILLAETLRVGGTPLVVAAEDPDTVTVRFPAPFGPGLRLLDGIPIFPRHCLEASLAEGTFASAWGLTTRPSALAGLGPFVLQRYDPGERLVFDRNPHYWRRDAEGRLLPFLDHIVLEIVPSQDAEQLRFTSGELDFTQSELRPSDYAILKRAEGQGRLTLTDLGVGLDGDLLWFNLNPAKQKDERSAWLQHADFRRAIAHAVDRDAFVNTVYLGAAVPAYGVVSPGNRNWYVDVPQAKYDVDAARGLLASLGLVDRFRDGKLTDATGTPVSFTLLTQSGNTSLQRGAAVIRESLGRLGVQVDVVELEVGVLIQHITRGDYDAVYFRLLTTDTDPALNPDFWLSSGSAHVWNPSQPSPTSMWEREIDRLMNQISTVADQDRRRALFADVQRIMAREVPVLCFAFPRMWFAMSNRIAHATPTPLRPPVLWNSAVISLRPDAH